MDRVRLKRKPAPPAGVGSDDAAPLPAELKPLFWEYDFRRLTWATDRDLIAARILAEGDGPAIAWLRRRLGNADLKAWLRQRRGRGLSPRQLRYWETILGLPHAEVTRWIEPRDGGIWAGRAH